MEIKPIRIPTNVIRTLPPAVSNNLPPPVVSGIEVPVVDIPNVIIDYPVIDAPTRETFEADLSQPQQTQQEEPQDSRQLPPPAPPAEVVEEMVVEVAGVEVALPPVDVIATAGATAVVATTASLVAAVVVKQGVAAAEPLIKNALAKMMKPKKLKVKAKVVKPVLHYVLTDSGKIDIFEYSKDGTKIVDSTDSVEMYLRDKLDNDSLYDITSKVIIDDVIKDKFTKEGKERFKKLFVPPAKIAKNLAAKFSF